MTTRTLRHGDTGTEVSALQRRLVFDGHAIAVDGVYGPATERAVRAYQRAHDLVVDGLAGPVTRAALEGAPLPATLRESDIVAAAERLGVEPAAVHAVTEVEARGCGFEPSGDPVILYERHVMYRRLGAYTDPEPWARSAPEIVNPEPGGYVGGAAEHDRLQRATAIRVTPALESASWGLFQIMGYHWERLGYAGIGEFVARMRESEAAHLDAFVRFVRADSALHAALRRQDWRAFARRYNGPAFERNDYDARLAAAYRRHREAEV
ncbi:N-acetylmuramidase domain-containing protein [Arhodomonas sp. AD133]|uniref:N-acetylmuramidase domain-containing protein n=1 Tax=Arhodomonas sp. AD133 TaxID=3415009 RepID=UPI003EC0F158